MSKPILQITDDLIKEVIGIARKAGDAVMDVYATDFDIQIKDDLSPVTNADKQANSIIISGLNRLDDSIPILSEEGHNIIYEERREWQAFWLIDPLDGTKEFIKKNGEFTVNIALIEDQAPVFGVVYAPALNVLYWGSMGYGAFKQKGNSPLIQIAPLPELDDIVKIACSRSHTSDRMNGFLDQFDKFELQIMGSSLKICLVADGSCHFYPRFCPTKEWDTAAAHGVLKAGGGEIIKFGTNTPIKYNKQDMYNPFFISGNVDQIEKLDY